MKYIGLIFFFVYYTSKAQVAPPDLRCLQVKPNGGVLLTWLPPSDPGLLFDSYVIYYSPSAAASFSIIGNVNSINTTTFSHSGSNASTSSAYYFIKTKFGSGGTSVSQPSDTLRTIFLNLLNTAGAPDIKIIYNNLHQPKLTTSSPTFSILKEYPALTWNNFASTSALNYADTISICQANLNYQITLNDNSGCISTSNIQGGTYNDKKNPNQPYVDSISVLPNGNTVLAWHIPRDIDITKYIIVKNISGIYTPIDSVIGRNNTFYNLNTNEANNNSVKLYVFAKDSCANQGAFDTIPRSMFLTAVYDKCGYKTSLSWNPYVNLPKGILEYRIYASINNAPFLKIGSTSQTFFTHNNVSPDKNVCYLVRVINNTQNITASSNKACIYSKQVQAANYVYIKRATIKDKNTAEIAVFIDTSKTSIGIDILRSEDGINYNSVYFIPYDGNTNYVFEDNKISSNNNIYYYKAVIKDSCGNYRTQSNVSKTILVKVKDDEENLFVKHINWTSYSGFLGGVSGYNIYRVINDEPATAPIASFGPTADSSFTDNIENEASNGSKIEYMIEAVEGIGNTYGFLEKSNSNKADVYMEGKLFIPNAFAPKGKNKIWKPVTHFIDKQEYSVSVFNRWGNLVFQTNDDTVGWDGGGNKGDVYAFLITYKNARGEYKEVKGTVLLID